MHDAQAQLADAYLAAGQGAEARVVAEDLVAREPWEQAHIERFRRALVLLNEPNPDAVIADRLSGQGPFVSTDPFIAPESLIDLEPDLGGGAEAASPQATAPSPAAPLVPEAPAVEAQPAPEPVAEPVPAPSGGEADIPLRPRAEADIPLRPRTNEADIPLRPRAAEPDIPLRPRNAEPDIPLRPRAAEPDIPLRPRGGEPDIPLRPRAAEPDIPLRPRAAEPDIPLRPRSAEPDIPLKPKAPETAPAAKPGASDIDLTSVLAELQQIAAAPTPPAAPAPPPAPPAAPLESVFADFRDEVSRQSGTSEAAEYLGLGKTYLDVGMPEEAIGALTTAARAPICRFEAASLLGRLYMKRGDTAHAVEWLERAAEAPAPGVAEARELLYDLGALLDSSGEASRALAVFLELQADAGEYRDVAARVERLARAQAGG